MIRGPSPQASNGTFLLYTDRGFIIGCLYWEGEGGVCQAIATTHLPTPPIFAPPPTPFHKRILYSPPFQKRPTLLSTPLILQNLSRK